MARILLIDDDRDLAYLTRLSLLPKGHDILPFHDAQKAMEAAKQQKPDLILMDIMLPGVSGAEAVKQLRKDPNLQNVPVVFLTGLISSAEEDVEKTGINIDGRTYQTLGKPYEIEDLLKVIEQTLNRTAGLKK